MTMRCWEPIETKVVGMRKAGCEGGVWWVYDSQR